MSTTATASRTGELRAHVLRQLVDLDPSALSGEGALAAVHELAQIEKAVAAARMFCAHRVATTDAWRGQGHASAADWLASVNGGTVAAARTQLGTAKRAQRHPRTKAEMDQGRLSPDEAAAITDAAEADPTCERDLLDTARNQTHAALRAEAARRKAAATDDRAREARVRRERSLRTRIDGDGAFHLSLHGPAIDGARLTALLKPFEEHAFRTARPEPDGTRPTYDNRSYDAFFAMLGTLAAARSAEPAAAPDASAPAPSGQPASSPLARALATVPGGQNTKVIVRIDHRALVRGHTIAGETCEVAGLGPIPVSTATALMGDAFLAAVITRGRDVLTVAHLGRGLNAHQRTAIEALGLRCTNQACNRTVALQIDHRVPYADVPETKLDNQDPLCPACHRQKTHHGWHLAPGRGPRAFLPPGVEPAPRAGPSPPPEGQERWC